MKLKNILFLSSIILSLAQLSAQTKIKGKIVNQQNQAIAGSHIILKNDLTGSISNRNGKFELIIRENQFPDTLLISHLSYQHVIVPINEKEKVEKELNIVMKTVNYDLSEIMVLNPYEVQNEAYKNLISNYHRDTAVLKLYYYNSEMRYWAQTDSTEWRKGESILYFLDESSTEPKGYKPANNEVVQLLQNNIEQSAGKPFRKWWKSNYLQILLSNNVYKHHQGFCIPDSEYKEMRLEINDTLSTREMIALDYVIKEKAIMRYMIKRSDSKIMRIEEYSSPEITSRASAIGTLFHRNKYSHSFDTLIINFQDINDQVYLRDIRMTHSGAWRDITTDSLLAAFHYNYRVVVTQTILNTSDLPDDGVAAKISKSFYLNEENKLNWDEMNKYIRLSPEEIPPDSLKLFMERIRMH